MAAVFVCILMSPFCYAEGGCTERCDINEPTVLEAVAVVGAAAAAYFGGGPIGRALLERLGIMVHVGLV